MSGRNQAMFLDGVRRRRVQAAKHLFTFFILCLAAFASGYFFGG